VVLLNRLPQSPQSPKPIPRGWPSLADWGCNGVLRSHTQISRTHRGSTQYTCRHVSVGSPQRSSPILNSPVRRTHRFSKNQSLHSSNILLAFLASSSYLVDRLYPANTEPPFFTPSLTFILYISSCPFRIVLKLEALKEPYRLTLR
jgi:hypothetical protein